ncbi:hypothetical protein CCHOA_02935 [Corynebacterium choanae]|uniref:Uncharacterized protein n=1 Tax=Corynebacterium choanae TaxID=1862358 RepID=A0A3G6J5H1_9CORY|nr:hypothetical protein CCHOA_02935 [Corynebacterium choanae]
MEYVHLLAVGVVVTVGGNRCQVEEGGWLLVVGCR